MSNEWNGFIQSLGFEPANHPDRGLYDLSHLGLIRVSGEDSAEFLQGQFTNDIREVTSVHSQMSSFCSPKGRMLSNFRIFQREGDYYIQIPANQLEALLKRLPMFILRAKVQISDASDDLVRIGVAGVGVEQILDRLIDDLPAEAGDVTRHQSLTLIRIPGETPRFEIIAPLTEAKTIWEQLAADTQLANVSHWGLLDIQAGIGNLSPATAEAFVPQMVNMERVDGVSFTKGCYTGQEVVARMKYLGKLKRRMYRAWIDVANQPQPGDTLYSADSDSPQGAGKVVDAQPAKEGGFELLVVTEITLFEQDNLHLDDPNGPKLAFRKLPYSLNEA